MPIEGLKQPETFNLTDEVGASVEALSILGLVDDRDRVAESLAGDFAHLQAAGVAGEPFVQVPRSLITLPNMLAAIDRAGYPKYPETIVFERLWIPGTEAGSYAATDIGNLELGQTDDNWPAHARLAVHNADNPNEPLLHFLDKPLDKKSATKFREETQLQALAKAQAQYEASHLGSDLAMTALNTPAVTMLALTHRIKGQAQPMPTEQGFMRDATLPRTTVSHISLVGGVSTGAGVRRLDWSRGNAHPSEGIGISVGPKSLKPQTF